MEKIKKSLEISGKNYQVESGELAKQANGACLIKIGDTTVLATVVAAKEPKPGTDFMPLTVNYRERTYSAGKIPGGFFKREGRPRENEILISRLIDRCMRPLFPEGWFKDTQINIFLLSYDCENDPEMAAIIGASVSLILSDLPFVEPVGAVRVGMIDGKLSVNPSISQMKTSALDMVVAGTAEATLMVEAGANELSEEQIIEALSLAHNEIKKICVFQKELKGKTKLAFAPVQIDTNLKDAVVKAIGGKISEVLNLADKAERENAWDALKKQTTDSLVEAFPETEKTINSILEDEFYKEARKMVIEKGVRCDKRKPDEIRNITCLTGLLPRTHGSSLFTRGQTQALATVTLGSGQDKQVMDELGGEYKERFMLHYNFPGFATGEAKPERGLSRREMGHGALARRALVAILPTEENFPYAIRIVSDILESNGSSSMASVCGGSLALFDAGVPVKAACAGIAMGLIQEGGKSVILSDIMGMEDHLGDMDFKVAGTRDGITALQMDIKTLGLTRDILSQALMQAKKGRAHILGKMEECISSPKSEMSVYAPKMVMMMINPSKIGSLIGPGGENIRKIQEDTSVEIDITDDGKVSISGHDSAAISKAKEMVEYLTAEIEVGRTYKGKVTRIMNFGAFVEILPGKEGLVHVSELSNDFVKNVETVVHEGEEVSVKVIEIDKQGRINLSRKAIL